MNQNSPNRTILSLDSREKNRRLYLSQVKTLDIFLEHGAISQAQHDKSLHDLTVRMGMEAVYQTAVRKGGKAQ
ncbi:MAG: hypothetical protein K6A68_15650 [Clostridiales bacterium]|nr:hypothetical protein [Clostridiales bacterium]